ncbi:hypothetical protein NPX13_g7208 [Xylaria arbuscula]|uniref:SWIM-type domain-containing protein n=1 Tax=Xylaria arbuscula TaxID=114810 RepID=A0A9W8NB02_9PEZI|nr:hypothetical protein NPX13_g7208 [Xylaria arbuscula]
MQSEESNITPQNTGAEKADIPAKMETEEDPKQWFEEDEYEPPESFSEASPEADPMKVDKAEPKEEAIEPKLSKAKDVKETKSLPIDPAKLKAAMAAKPKAMKSPKAKLAAASRRAREQAASKPAGVKTSTGIKPAVSKLAGAKRTTDTRPTGSKPTGVKKSVKKPSIAKPLKLGKEVSVDDLLRKARVWVDRPKQWSIKDPETGCYGLSTQHAEGERREITIVHSINCDCLDVRLMHICKHVDALIRKRQLKRGSRDAFVIATKLDVELPQPIPKDIRFPHVKEQIIDSSRIAKPWREELEAEKKATIEGWKNDRQDYPETEARNVVDSYHQQPLIEKWKSLKGYKKRPIWRDW